MHINELHDLLNAMEQAGFTQRERNNERFRGIAQRLLTAHSAGAQAFAYSTVEHWLTEAAGEREVGHVVQEMTHMEVARQAFAAGRALSAGAQDASSYEAEHVSLEHKDGRLTLTLVLDVVKSASRYLVTPVNPCVVRAQPQPMTDDKEVRYQKVCAAAYQLAGLVEAPLRFLDALSNASNGEPMADAIELLPVTLDECGAMTDAARDERKLRPDEEALFKATVDELLDCNETATGYEVLLDWANRGLLECESFRIAPAGNDEIERIEREGEA